MCYTTPIDRGNLNDDGQCATRHEIHEIAAAIYGVNRPNSWIGVNMNGIFFRLEVSACKQKEY